jgi:hypothetical protein
VQPLAVHVCNNIGTVLFGCRVDSRTNDPTSMLNPARNHVLYSSLPRPLPPVRFCLTLRVSIQCICSRRLSEPVKNWPIGLIAKDQTLGGELPANSISCLMPRLGMEPTQFIGDLSVSQPIRMLRQKPLNVLSVRHPRSSPMAELESSMSIIDVQDAVV